MFDVNQPFAWKKAQTAMASPLGASIQASSAEIPQPGAPAQPGMGEQVAGVAGKAALNEGLDVFKEGMNTVSADTVAPLIAAEGAGTIATEAGSQAAMLADQMSGMGSEALSLTAEAGGGMSSMMGPLAAGAAGLAEGKYGKAAGAALGSAAGNAMIPVVGGMIGSYLGGALGGSLGFQDGTAEVPAGPAGKGMGTPTSIAPSASAGGFETSGEVGGKGMGSSTGGFTPTGTGIDAYAPFMNNSAPSGVFRGGPVGGVPLATSYTSAPPPSAPPQSLYPDNSMWA